MNTFIDFIACGEHLIAQRYASPQRIAISGRSAGGLLIGAVLNLRPDLWHAAVAGVPFVDVINTMSDVSIRSFCQVIIAVPTEKTDSPLRWAGLREKCFLHNLPPSQTIFGTCFHKEFLSSLDSFSTFFPD